jgi:hypothetical protein
VIVTKFAIAAGVVVLGVLIWLAAAGVSALTPVLVTGAALVLLVGGGNYLSGRSPHGPARGGGPAEPGDPAAGETGDPTGGAGNPTGGAGNPTGEQTGEQSEGPSGDPATLDPRRGEGR